MLVTSESLCLQLVLQPRELCPQGRQRTRVYHVQAIYYDDSDHDW